MRKIILIGWLLTLPFLLIGQHLTISPSGGFHTHAPRVTMNGDIPGAHVCYTVNGHTPTEGDRHYSEPMTLNASYFSKSDIYKIQISPANEVFVPEGGVRHAVVLRAALFDTTGQRISEVITNTYIISDLDGDSHGLPVISLCADSAELFDNDSGILVPGTWYTGDEWSGNYYQEGREWERIINAELLMPDGGGFNQTCGLRTHGGSGRRYPQKALKIYARDEYGKKHFSYKIFDDLEINKFKRLVLKPFRSAWTDAGIQNQVTEQLARNLNLDAPAIRPIVLYINGEYWGIYFLQEKTDERFLQDHYGNDEEDYNIMSNWVNLLDNGTDEYFQAMMQWLETADMTRSEDYAMVQQLIDISNFIDYQIFEIYTCNEDWPANNMRCWQYRTGPWRWIFYDGDACLKHLEWNAFDYAVYEGDDTYPASRTSTLLFRKLLANQDFQKRFTNRYKNLINSLFNYYQVKPYIDAAKRQIEDEIQNQVERFRYPNNLNDWKSAIAKMNDYFLRRPTIALQELLTYLPPQEDAVSEIGCVPNPTSGHVRLTIETSDPGIRIISIYNLMGELVFNDITYCETGNNEVELWLPMPAGAYVLRIGNQSAKIVIK